MDLSIAISELKDELRSKPSLLQDEREVIQKFGTLFRYDNIDNISVEEFQSFLDIKHNRHWTLHRLKTALTRDMPKLRTALKILLNESISLEERLRRIRDRHSPDYKENMGRAIFSPILLVTSPSKYPVYNGTVERAFEKLDIKLENEDRPIWYSYPEVQKLIVDIASKYDLSLWQMDMVWWKVVGGISYADLIKYIRENRMQENYQPVLIKMLIDNISSGVTRQQIEEQLHNYNLGSTSQSMTDTVLSVLKNNDIIRKEQNEYVLNLSEDLSVEEANTVRSLCEQKIKEFENKQSSVKYWKIAPGENASKWEEHRANGIIAIGWREMEIGDLSNHSIDAIREEIKRHYPDGYRSIIPQFENFLSIKKGDIIIANKGYSKVLGIGKVTGPYQYRSDLTYHHTYPVEWFDTKERGVPPQTGTWRKTVSVVSPELYNEIISGRSKNYVLLRHQPPFKRKKSEREYWDDLFGKEYHFGKNVPNYKKVYSGTKAVWFYTDNGDLYFWGHGDIDKVTELTDDKFIATHESFDLFDNNGSPIKASISLQQKIESLDGWNPYNSIIEIDEEIYEEIIYAAQNNREQQDLGQERESIQDLKVFDDEKLVEPTLEDLKIGYQEVSEELLVPEEKVIEIVTALASGRHILLAGPIGTGKTRLAKMIPEIFWKNIGGYLAEEHTATADWSTQDVIGGIMPKMENGKVVYQIQYGCAVDTIRKNWQHDIEGGRRIEFKSPIRNVPYRGIWLVIDEFNRADIDKAFGQLFTTLRTHWLKIPTDRIGYSYAKLKIPEDYRIIGTLNTSDKHFLFGLSDALKSRFAYIEVDIPSRQDSDKEIYYAMKNAVAEVASSNSESLVSLDTQNKKITVGSSNPEFYKRAYQAYYFLDSVRLFKKLGTAMLQLIYQNMLVAAKIIGDTKMALDYSLTSTLVPQLESLPQAEIGTLSALHEGSLVQLKASFMHFGKVRDDKNPEDATDITELISMYRQQMRQNIAT